MGMLKILAARIPSNYYPRMMFTTKIDVVAPSSQPESLTPDWQKLGLCLTLVRHTMAIAGFRRHLLHELVP
jgi:hypothetical protein